MDLMKRSVSILLLLCILFSLFGCETDTSYTPTDSISATEESTAETALTSPAEVTTDTQPVPTQDITEPTTEPATEPTTVPVTGPATEPTAEPVTEPTIAPTQHSHNFSPATCTDPKICTTCGETEGKAAGHIWKDATCTSPKTCKTCGDTSGSKADHDYSGGVCRSCGKEQPNYSSGEMVWIPRTGKKYHCSSSCSNMKNPSQVTKSEAISMGYTPCKKCY